MKSTAAILAAAMFVGDHMMASTSLAGAAAVATLRQSGISHGKLSVYASVSSQCSTTKMS